MGSASSLIDKETFFNSSEFLKVGISMQNGNCKPWRVMGSTIYKIIKLRRLEKQFNQIIWIGVAKDYIIQKNI